MKRALGANYRPAWDSKMWECYAAKKKDAGKELDERDSDIVAAGEQTGDNNRRARGELALLRESDGLHLAGTMVRQAMKAGEDEGEDTGVLTTRLRQEDDQRRRILCSRFLQKSTDFLRWIIAAVGGREELHCRTCALTAIVSRLKTTSGGFRRGREEVQLVVRGVRRPLRLEESRVLVYTGQHGPQRGGRFWPTLRCRVRVRILTTGRGEEG